MMMKYFIPLIAALVLSGCAVSSPLEQKTQKVQTGASRTLDMEQLCRAQAAHRYNTRPDKISVIGFEQYQGSYEMRGYTLRKEAFICSFDSDGNFSHLSMRQAA